MDKEVLIIGNGENVIPIEQIKKFKNIICADGGYEHIRGEVEPLYIIGDMDSVKSIPKHINKIQYSKDKDITDTELCINKAIDNGFERIYITGIYGSRPDHFFAVLTLLEKYKTKKIFLLTDKYDIFIIEPFIDYRFIRMKGKTVSFFSLRQKTDITMSNGFKYELSGVSLKKNNPIGVSNRIIDKDSGIYYEKGLLVCFLET